MKKIYIKESTYQHVIKEEKSVLMQNIQTIMTDLDNNYDRMIANIPDGGKYKQKPIFVKKIDKSQLDCLDMLDFLSHELRWISNDENKRKLLIIQILKDWYSKYWHKNHKLSANVAL